MIFPCEIYGADYARIAQLLFRLSISSFDSDLASDSSITGMPSLIGYARPACLLHSSFSICISLPLVTGHTSMSMILRSSFINLSCVSSATAILRRGVVAVLYWLLCIAGVWVCLASGQRRPQMLQVSLREIRTVSAFAWRDKY